MTNYRGFGLEDSWAIRPCFLYKEEYDDCTSIKARFHQYFIHGKNIDCTQWKKDYENCIKYENNDLDAGKEIIKSEEERRKKRFNSHFSNNIWKKRQKPPEDWNKPLPEWMIEKNKNTFLELKANEINNNSNTTETLQKSDKTSNFCNLM